MGNYEHPTLLEALGLTTSQPGLRQRGGLSVLGTNFTLPFIHITGTAPGPALLVTGGVHGGEYCGIQAALDFANQIDPTQLAGHVTVIPLANPPAFYAKEQYVVPEDGKNLNRAFPGNPDGSLAERMAYAIMRAAKAHEYWVDLHSGDLHEALLPFVIYSPNGPAAVAADARRMASAYGIPVLVESASIAGGSYAAAAEAGIAAILPESGQMGQVDPVSITRHREGIERVCQALQMLPGAPPVFAHTVHTESIWTRAPQSGLHYPCLEVGQVVAAGQTGAVLRDAYGDVRDIVLVPHDGRVLFRATSLAIVQGDPLFAVIAP